MRGMINSENILVLALLIYGIVSILLIEKYKKRISELEQIIKNRE